MRTYEERDCGICGKRFKAVKKHKPPRIYCSLKCNSKAHRDRLREKNIKRCSHCGKNWQWSASHPQQRFCSRACAQCARQERYTAKLQREGRSANQAIDRYAGSKFVRNASKEICMCGAPMVGGRCTNHPKRALPPLSQYDYVQLACRE